MSFCLFYLVFVRNRVIVYFRICNLVFVCNDVIAYFCTYNLVLVCDEVNFLFVIQYLCAMRLTSEAALEPGTRHQWLQVEATTDVPARDQLNPTALNLVSICTSSTFNIAIPLPSLACNQISPKLKYTPPVINRLHKKFQSNSDRMQAKQTFQ